MPRAKLEWFDTGDGLRLVVTEGVKVQSWTLAEKTPQKAKAAAFAEIAAALGYSSPTITVSGVAGTTGSVASIPQKTPEEIRQEKIASLEAQIDEAFQSRDWVTLETLSAELVRLQESPSAPTGRNPGDYTIPTVNGPVLASVAQSPQYQRALAGNWHEAETMDDDDSLPMYDVR